MLTLGTVIMRLSDKKNNAPIPYRDSKLTRLLQPALEGDSKVSIICNISPCPDAYDETLSTLKFAHRAKKIKQTIIKNEVIDSKALIMKYQNEIQQLQERLREMEVKMSQEENSAISKMVNSQLLLLQEEKETTDAKLEKILHEKLQLQQDLERLRSFIIHAEDVKPPKLLSHETEDIIKHEIEEKTKKELFKSKTHLNHRPLSGVYLSPSMKPSIIYNENEFSEMKNPLRQETMLINGIEDIEFELESGDPLKSVSVFGSEAPTTEDFLRIIDEQARTIRSLQNGLNEKDALIKELSNSIAEKDDAYELINDELRLCRNNLAKMQISLRLKKNK